MALNVKHFQVTASHRTFVGFGAEIQFVGTSHFTVTYIPHRSISYFANTLGHPTWRPTADVDGTFAASKFLNQMLNGLCVIFCTSKMVKSHIIITIRHTTM